MKNDWGYRLFCAAFALVLVLPGVLTILLGPSRAGANEVLARPPQPVKAGRPNVAFLHDAAAYFDDHFALRQALIMANASLTAGVFHASAAPEVILGRESWLYYADTLGDYTQSAPMTERQLYCAARSLFLMQEYAASQGCAFVFAAAPNKNTLYPQYMPARYQRGAGGSNLTRLYALLAQQQVTACDLRAALLAADEPVYYRTDSHWTGYGSALAHDALLAALGREGSLSDEAFSMQPHLGDLYEMLYPAGTQQEQGLRLSRERTFSYAGTVHGADDLLIRTQCAQADGSVVMFRDSFGNTLHEDLAESFGAACFSRAMPYDLTLLHQEQADTLIVELVERNLGKLATLAPILPGPVRQLRAPESSVPATLSLTREDSGAFDCVCYTGMLTCAAMDWDSPAYVCLDGTVYEACPTQTGFSLYAPAAAEVLVYVVADGALVRCDTK